MGRYLKTNILQTAIDAENNQQHLKTKHNIQEENVIVVEKSSIFKWFAMLLKVTFTVTLFALAAIGIFTLLYPELRNEFIKILIEIFNAIGGK